MSLGIVMVGFLWQDQMTKREMAARLGRMLYFLVIGPQTYGFSHTADRFKEQFEAAREGLGPQEFDWYPYDSFGYIPRLDMLLKGRLSLVRAMVGDEPVLDAGCGDGALSYFM